MIIKKLLASLFCLAIGFVFVHSAPAETVKIGVLAKRGALKTMRKWKPTADFLTEKTSLSVEVVPLDFDQLPQAVKKKSIDFVLTNSSMYVQLKQLYGIKAIATLLNAKGGTAVDKFGGVIFVPKDSPVNKLGDFKGRTFGFVKKTSFGGWQMAKRLFLDNGIVPARDFKAVKELGKHDFVVYAVRNKAVDGGTVRSDTLEKMESEGKIKLTDFKIIHQVKDDFPYVHSTQLYPEWPMAACSHTPAGVVKAVKSALLSMPSNHPAALAAKIGGWKDPLDYSAVAECLKVIKGQ